MPALPLQAGRRRVLLPVVALAVVLLVVSAAVLLGTGGVVADARPAPVKKTRCFTTSEGDRICLKYDCRGKRCVKTHRCDQPKGAPAMLCTPVAGRTSSNGLGCSAGIPPYYYRWTSINPIPQNGSDPYHIRFEIDKHLPVPDGYDYRQRFSWHGKRGAAICLAKMKINGARFEVRCSAGPCYPDLPSIKGDGYFDVLARPKISDPRRSESFEIIVRGA